VASTPTDRRVHLVLDFDGTITVRDTGDDLFRTFGQFEPIHSQLLDGEMSVAEYYRRSAAMLKADLTPEEVRTWADERQIDPGLADLVALCRRHGVRVVVASDGFDAYIRPILDRAAIGPVDIHCNTLEHRADGQWDVSFPGASESCSCFCASCKRNAVLSHLGESDILIYVGDGRSDTCAARHADIIFAKDHLAAWCNEERIPHHPFKTLHDVRRLLAGRFATGDLKPRRQAVLARAEAVKSE